MPLGVRLGGPVSTCNENVVVTQVLPGATVRVKSGGIVIGELANAPFNPDHIVIVDLNKGAPKAGEGVTATQETDVESSPSLPYYPIVPPKTNSARFRDKQRVTKCTRCVAVDAAMPGSIITIHEVNDPQPISAPTLTIHGSAQVGLLFTPNSGKELNIVETLPAKCGGFASGPDGRLGYFPDDAKELYPPYLHRV